jgi:hypothetical protein
VRAADRRPSQRASTLCADGVHATPLLRTRTGNGPAAAWLVRVASKTSSRTWCVPFGTDRVSHAIVPEAVGLQGTTFVYGGSQSPTGSSATAVPSTSSTARATPPPASDALNDAATVPDCGRVPSIALPLGETVKVGSATSSSVTVEDGTVMSARLPAGQLAGWPLVQSMAITSACAGPTPAQFPVSPLQPPPVAQHASRTRSEPNASRSMNDV